MVVVVVVSSSRFCSCSLLVVGSKGGGGGGIRMFSISVQFSSAALIRHNKLLIGETDLDQETCNVI